MKKASKNVLLVHMESRRYKKMYDQMFYDSIICFSSNTKILDICNDKLKYVFVCEKLSYMWLK